MIFLILCIAGKGLFAEQNPDDSADLFEMSIEDLMNVEVAVSAKSQSKMFDTPAAVYVITSEDIRRSGAMIIPDALRMVRGLRWQTQGKPPKEQGKTW